MNLFRSEEHASNWSEFDVDMAPLMLKPVAEGAEIFSNPFFRERGRPACWVGVTTHLQLVLPVFMSGRSMSASCTNTLDLIPHIARDFQGA